MINYGTLTGMYDASGYIGVKLSHGEELYARPLFQSGAISSYPKKWVEKYGKNFMAVIAYENSQKERAVLMGLIPLKNPKFPEEKTEENMFFISENWRVWFNESAKEYILDALVSDAKIKMGSKDVTEPAILGNIWADSFKEFISDVGQISGISTPEGPSGPISSSPAWAALVTKWEQKVETIKSKTVFLK